MNLKQIENEALHLPENERAQLAQKLLISLDSLSPDEVESAWSQEAQHRASQLNDGTVELVDGEQVMRKAMALLK